MHFKCLLLTLNVKVKNGSKSKMFFIFKFKTIHFDIFADRATLIKSSFTPLRHLLINLFQMRANHLSYIADENYGIFTSRSIGPPSYQHTGNPFWSTQGLNFWNSWTSFKIGSAQTLFRDLKIFRILERLESKWPLLNEFWSLDLQVDWDIYPNRIELWDWNIWKFENFTRCWN